MSYTLKNFAWGELASDVDATDMQVTLVSGNNLPKTGTFVAVVWDMDTYSNPADDPNTEIMEFSYSGVGEVFDVTRAKESTLSVAHDSGDQVALHLTAGVLGEYQINGDVLDDLSLLGAPTSDGEFIVATGAGVFAYESGDVARASLGLGTGDSPQFAALDVTGSITGGSLNLSGLTASRLLSTDASNNLESISDLTSWVAGTAGQISVSDDGDGSITLALTGNMDDLAALTPTDGNFIVGDGTNWVAESGNTARTSLGLGTGDSPIFAGVIIQESDAGSISPLGSYSLAVVGKDSSSSTYPSINLYTDADNYPIFAYLPYSHNNMQLCFNWYWNGSAAEVCSTGGVYRIFATNDDWSIGYYDGSGDSPGDVFATASLQDAFTVDIDEGEISFNRTQNTLPYVFYGDSDTDLIYVDTGNNKVGIGCVPTAKLDVGGDMAADSLALSDTSGAILDAGPWSDRPGSIQDHTHCYGALFTGLTSDTGGAYTGTTPSQISLSANINNGAIQFNRYWTGAASAQFDSAKSSWRMLFDGNSDYWSLGRSAAGSTSITDNLKLDCSAGKFTVNEAGEDYDFIVEGDDDPNLIHTDAANDNIGIGTDSPSSSQKVHIYTNGWTYGTQVTLQCGDAKQSTIGFTTPTGSGYIGAAGTSGQVLFDVDDGDVFLTNRSGGAIRISADTSYYASGGLNILETGSVGIKVKAPNATLDVNGDTRLGDSDTNYTAVSSTGDVTFVGSAGFYPVRLSQSTQPTPDTGEMVTWRDPDDNKTYVVYNDTDEGVRKVEMT